MKTIWMSLAVLAMLTSAASAGDGCASEPSCAAACGNGCGDPCGNCGNNCCHKVCKLVCETKKVKLYVYGCKCEDICLPKCSDYCCEHCTCECLQVPHKPDACGNDCCCHSPLLVFRWKDWQPECGCADIRCVHKLTKYEVVKEIPWYHWEVVCCCDGCGNGCGNGCGDPSCCAAGCTAAPEAAPVAAPVPAPVGPTDAPPPVTSLNRLRDSDFVAAPLPAARPVVFDAPIAPTRNTTAARMTFPVK